MTGDERPPRPQTVAELVNISDDELAQLPPQVRILVKADRAATAIELRAQEAAGSELAQEIVIQSEFDKSDWGPGPWQDEPDLVMWRSKIPPHYRCQVSRNGFGSLCGYVAVPPGHPAHGIDYGDERMQHVVVHGELTFAGPGTGGVWIFGFDCGHGFDIQPAMDARMRKMGMRPVHEEMSHLGFNRDPDYPFVDRYRAMPYVRAIVEGLAIQLFLIEQTGQFPAEHPDPDALEVKLELGAEEPDFSEAPTISEKPEP